MSNELKLSSPKDCTNLLPASNNTSNTILDILDDDCLLEVFSYLSFEELLLTSRVCTKFLQLTRCRFRRLRHFELNYRALVERTDDQVLYIKDVFTNLGPNLNAFRFSGGFIMNKTLKSNILNSATQNCDILQHLSLNYIELNAEHLSTLKRLLPQLKSLNLGRCSLKDETFGPFIEASFELISLAIPGNAELDGSFFDKWQSCAYMEMLDVSYCYSLNVGTMRSFLPRAPNLRGVDVTACQWLQKDKGIFNSCIGNIESTVVLPEFNYYKNT